MNNLFMVFALYFLCCLQGIDDGWYDGGSIAFAVILVIVVTGIWMDMLIEYVCMGMHVPGRFCECS